MARMLAVVSFIIFLPLFAYAQIIPIPEQSVEIVASPEYPKPFSTVVLTANTFNATNLIAYRWSVDGVPALEGVGANTLSLQVGSIGQSYDVRLEIVSTDGRTVGTTRYVVRPADVDLVWEARTFVPSFYIGRRLPTATSDITVLALPFLRNNVSGDDASAYTYEWSVDSQRLSEQSGLGKTSATITPPFFSRPFNVSVLVSTDNGSLAARETIHIAPITPLAIIYEDNPLLGLLTHRLLQGTLTLIDEEVTLLAFPYFVDNPDEITYAWSLNNKSVETDGDMPNKTTLKRTGGVRGVFPVGVSFTGESSSDSGSSFFNLSL